MTETDETRRMLRDSVAAYVARSDSVRRHRRLREVRPGCERAAWRDMAEAGWFGLLVPEALGGLGLGCGELAAVMEEIGRGLVPEPVGPAAVLALGAVLHAGESDLRMTLTQAIASGETIVALAWQERASEHDPRQPEAALRPTGAGFALDGTKRFVPMADCADRFLVPAAAPEGVVLCCIDADAEGVSAEHTLLADGSFAATLRLDGVTVPRERVLADGAAAVARALDEARLGAAAELVGVAARALELALDFVRQRVQFGKPIGSFQALQHRIVDLWIQTELARASLAEACAVFDRTGDTRARAIAVSAAKARASDAALLVTRQAVQLHGGMGYTDEADIGLYLKRALVLSAWLGNGAAMRRRFARLTAPD